MRQINAVHITNELHYFTRRQIIRHPAAELGRDIEFAIAIRAGPAKTGCNGTSRETTGKVLLTSWRWAEFNFIFKNRTTALVYIVAFVNE
ncbi:hypothetical protein D3C85_1227320 [compost metagenome]